MTLTIEIKPELEDILRRRGVTGGQELATYVEHLIEEDNTQSNRAFAARDPVSQLWKKPLARREPSIEKT